MKQLASAGDSTTGRRGKESEFDLRALYEALDAQRRSRQLAWTIAAMFTRSTQW